MRSQFPLTAVPPKLHNQVRTLRLSAGISSQLSLARQTGLPQYLISRWETHQAEPEPKYGAVLAEFFRVHMEIVYSCSSFNSKKEPCND